MSNTAALLDSDLDYSTDFALIAEAVVQTDAQSVHISDVHDRSCVPSIGLSPNQPPFSFVLNAPPALASTINEGAVTYLNQGQLYQIRVQYNFTNNDYQMNTFRSIICLCFWDQTAQQQEDELIQKWTNEYSSPFLFDIDMKVTQGITSILRSPLVPNAIEIVWNAYDPVSLFLRFHCTSTDFVAKRHGGEKGVPLRLQIDTYQANEHQCYRHLDSSCCKFQLFRLKGAQRKAKLDRIRMKRFRPDEDSNQQTIADSTVLKSYRFSILYTKNLLSLSYPASDLMEVSDSSEFWTAALDKNENRRQIMEDNMSSSSESLIGTFGSSHMQVDPPDGVGKITIYSTKENVTQWLRTNQYESVLHRFQDYNGLDLLRLSIDDMRRICNGDDAISIRLHHQLHEKLVQPLRTLYIKLYPNEFFSAIYLHRLTRQELEERLFELLKKSPEEILTVFVELKKIKVRIDTDDIVKYSLPNEAPFHLNVSFNELVLIPIHTSIS